MPVSPKIHKSNLVKFEDGLSNTVKVTNHSIQIDNDDTYIPSTISKSNNIKSTSPKHLNEKFVNTIEKENTKFFTDDLLITSTGNNRHKLIDTSKFSSLHADSKTLYTGNL